MYCNNFAVVRSKSGTAVAASSVPTALAVSSAFAVVRCLDDNTSLRKPHHMQRERKKFAFLNKLENMNKLHFRECKFSRSKIWQHSCQCTETPECLKFTKVLNKMQAQQETTKHFWRQMINILVNCNDLQRSLINFTILLLVTIN